MQFLKVHGAGNDFILLPDLDDRLPLAPGLVRALCDRHLGLGADGVIRVAPSRDGIDADVFMDYWNADGTVAEMCGNGVRCVAKYVADRSPSHPDIVTVDTRAGTKPVWCERGADGRVARARVDMGAPSLTGKVELDVSPTRLEPPGPGLSWMATAERRLVTATTLSMGNPHAVLVVDDVASAPVAWWGPLIEHDEAFPDGTNVEFIAAAGPDRVSGRIWERGVGETQASGTGASAMAVAAHVLGLAGRQVRVELPGGELDIDWAEETLFVTGPAVEVGAGELDEDWLATAGATA